jgi:uncharacterized protein YfcZ (UPF0381/DUF406 family)
MSAIRTTYGDPMARVWEGPTILPYLHPREIDSTLDAIADGDLVAVADPREGAIIALATPEIAKAITNRPDVKDVVNELLSELREARRELDNLRQIAREVLAEKEPTDWDWKIEDAADDVQKALDGATDHAEDLRHD